MLADLYHNRRLVDKLQPHDEGSILIDLNVFSMTLIHPAHLRHSLEVDPSSN